jgi:hypothetical protein
MIPKFDHNNVLPPHLGNPSLPSDLSPYECSTIEVCERFSTSKERIAILKGLIEFRIRLNEKGVINGFQWLDGSFLENIEISENRPPRDLDIITFYGGLSDAQQNDILHTFPEFVSQKLSKDAYKLDHYAVDYCYDPNATVELTRYWIQLFTHNRSGVWKGILRLPLSTPTEDMASLHFLNNLVL